MPAAMPAHRPGRNGIGETMSLDAFSRLLRPVVAVCSPLLVVATEVAAETELFLELRPEKQQVYIHEPLTVSVTLLAGQVTLRDIRYPRLKHPAFRIGEFAPPHQDTLQRQGQDYRSHAFAATLLPLKPGRHTLGPAELDCDRLDPDTGAAAYFGASEPRSVTLHSETTTITVLPLPAQGRPADFSGAVGRYRLSRQAAPLQVAPGDPVLLTTHIQGSASGMAALTCPEFAQAGMRAYPPRTVRTSERLLCEQVLVPQIGGRLEIPAYRFSYFDPLSERYHTLNSPALSLQVSAPATPPAPVSAPVAAVTPSGGLPGWRIWMGVLMMAALAWHFLRRRNIPEQPVDNRESARAALRRAEAAEDPTICYEAAFRCAQILAAAPAHQPAPGISAAPDGDRRLAEVFRECDAVRYGRAPRGEVEMKKLCASLREVLADRS